MVNSFCNKNDPLKCSIIVSWSNCYNIIMHKGYEFNIQKSIHYMEINEVLI